MIAIRYYQQSARKARRIPEQHRLQITLTLSHPQLTH